MSVAAFSMVAGAALAAYILSSWLVLPLI